MGGDGQVTRLLAAFAAGADPAEAARAMMRLSLFDWAACGIAGRDEPVARLLRQMVDAEAGRAEAAVIGSTVRVPARAAALANGATSHALDYDDTHFDHIGHPSVAVIPAALALAERGGADGAEMLDAALVGAEASIRLGVWLGRGHYQTGFHQTATAGAFGAAAAAARLLGLDAAQTAHALGLAATKAAGLKSQFGTMGKPYNAGIAAATGVEVALLAAAGFVSRPDGIECAQGFGATHAGAGDDAAFDGLGRHWRFLSVSHKFHACCHGTHAALEALATLADGLDPATVEAVELTVHPRWLTVCDIAEPETGLEVKFSYRMTAAMALSGRDTAAMQSFSDATAADPALRALAARVRVRGEDRVAETAAEVRLRLTDGAVREASHDLAQPISFDLRTDKLRAKAAALLGEPAAARLWSVTGEAVDLPGLVRELSGGGA
jgi:2-methylcitrate dehydratase PrpD